MGGGGGRQFDLNISGDRGSATVLEREFALTKTVLTIPRQSRRARPALESKRISRRTTSHVIKTWFVVACIRSFSLAECSFILLRTVASNDTEHSGVVPDIFCKVALPAVLTLAHVYDNSQHCRSVLSVCGYEL